jgi:hypothetical protein
MRVFPTMTQVLTHEIRVCFPVNLPSMRAVSHSSELCGKGVLVDQ